MMYNPIINAISKIVLFVVVKFPLERDIAIDTIMDNFVKIFICLLLDTPIGFNSKVNNS